jgi:hypothetical protein
VRTKIVTSQWSTRKKAAIATVAAAAVGIGSFLVANASTAAQSITASKTNPVYWTCLNSSHQIAGGIRIYDGSGAYPGCGSGYTKAWWSQQGPQGVPGPDGASGLQQFTAQTAITNWPESSGWATDEMTRSVVITRESAAPSTDCGGAATCWFYTATLADNGRFYAHEGAKSPNRTLGGSVAHDTPGIMMGGATVEFYSNSDLGESNAVGFPTTQDGKHTYDTTNWVKQAFPANATFSGLKLTGYKWTYSSCFENWVDAINPGDDGQGATDGNIDGAICNV